LRRATRVPPQSLEAEQAVLGAMLLERSAIDAAVGLLVPDDFYRDAHKLIFRAAGSLAGRNEPVDLTTLAAELETRGHLEQVGGRPYLAALLDAVPTAAHVEYYAKIVADKAVLRRLIGVGTDIVEGCFGDVESAGDVVARAEAALRAITERAGQAPGRNGALKSRTAAELAAMQFAPVRWAVQDLIPEGLCLFVGKSKLGKSFLAFSLCIAVACGGRALGMLEVQPGEALYLALEDNARRLQGRLFGLWQQDRTEEALRRLHWETTMPRLDRGGVQALDSWLLQHPECRLVVIDTLARVRPPVRSRANAYQEDTEALAPLQALALARNVAILLVHHTRKAEAMDVLDEVSGSTGLVGVADTILVLHRGRGEAEGVLSVTGRDVTEQELALRKDPDGGWVLLGDAREHAISKERREVLDLLKQHAPEALSRNKIASLLGKPSGTIARLCAAMVKDGILSNDGSGYVVVQANTPNTPNTPEQGEHPEHVRPVRPAVAEGEHPHAAHNPSNGAISDEGCSGCSGVFGVFALPYTDEDVPPMPEDEEDLEPGSWG